MSPHIRLQHSLTMMVSVSCSKELVAGMVVVTKVPGCRCNGHVLGKPPRCADCARKHATRRSELCVLCNHTPQELPSFKDYPGEWLRRFLTCGELWGCPAGPLPWPGVCACLVAPYCVLPKPLSPVHHSPSPLPCKLSLSPAAFAVPLPAYTAVFCLTGRAIVVSPSISQLQTILTRQHT